MWPAPNGSQPQPRADARLGAPLDPWPGLQVGGQARSGAGAGWMRWPGWRRGHPAHIGSKAQERARDWTEVPTGRTRARAPSPPPRHLSRSRGAR
jgi:hypothetical protein